MSDLAVSVGPEHPVSLKLPGEAVRALSQVKPVTTVLHVTMEWAAVIGAAWLAHHFWNPLLYVVVVMWIGARQHALALLMHDGAHYLLFRNKRLNDVVAETLLAWPIFITMRGYRKTHLAHHRHLNTDQDPDWTRKQNADWEFPMNSRRLMGLLVADALGLNTLKVLRRLGDLSNEGDRSKDGIRFQLMRAAYYLLMFAVIGYFHAWTLFLLYWAVPALTWLKLIMRVRSIAEHFALVDDRLGVLTRTTYPSLFDRFFVCSKNAYLHIEHHLYPGVPFHGLPGLHAHLREVPGFMERAHITRSYWSVLKESMGQTVKVA